jgi:hypothetical protein
LQIRRRRQPRPESTPGYAIEVIMARRSRAGLRSVVLCLARPEPNDVFQASRLPFDPGSIARCRESVVLRGGALEPDSCLPAGKAQAKADAYSPMAFPSARLQRSFSLRRGLDSILSFSS